MAALAETSQRSETTPASVRHRLPSLAWLSACCKPKPRINLRREPTSITCCRTRPPLNHLQPPFIRNGRSVLHNSSAQLPSVLPKRKQRDLSIGNRGLGKTHVPVLVTHSRAMPHLTNYHVHIHNVYLHWKTTCGQRESHTYIQGISTLEGQMWQRESRTYIQRISTLDGQMWQRESRTYMQCISTLEDQYKISGGTWPI